MGERKPGKRPYWPVHPDEGGSIWWYIWRCFCIGLNPPPVPRIRHDPRTATDTPRNAPSSASGETGEPT